jgi:phospho-N-acetylmuramoyl-pentapeptide-transferase
MTPQIPILVLLLTTSNLLVFPAFIGLLCRIRFTQHVRGEGPTSHLAKAGTPTGGGLLLAADVALVTIVYLFNVRGSHALSRVDVATLGFIVLNLLAGLVDDVLKEVRHANTGLLGYQKLLIQCAASVFLLWVAFPQIAPQLHLQSMVLPIGWVFYVLAVLYAVGMVNAFNLTDGLDGLLAKTSLPVFALATVFSFRQETGLAGWLPAAALAFCIAFLWFNTNKAAIFMGDTGSLTLGSIFVAWAFVSKNDVSSVLIGGLFLVEAASVMIQVLVFRATGRRRRVFLMAPIHHHFEKLGWEESKIVDRFFVVSLLFTLVGALTMRWGR